MPGLPLRHEYQSSAVPLLTARKKRGRSPTPGKYLGSRDRQGQESRRRPPVHHRQPSSLLSPPIAVVEGGNVENQI
ncbi:hypothetical protein MLD38_036631 [Melastoma candidum]|uniref:Uncharacterized protein n=1 Tax=Melastoma candidum TaxID=119954 RepID=A0ACB9LKV0_9MYRT|nr:hypothetical protein MLD38_036631 [Melastoma candidum]